MFEDDAAKLVAKVLIEPAHQHRARFLGRELRLPVEHFALLRQDQLHLGALFVQVLLLLGKEALDRLELALLTIDEVQLLIEQVCTFFEALFLLAESAAGLFGLRVDGLASLERLFLGFEVGRLADVLGLALRVGHDLDGTPARGLGSHLMLDENYRAADRRSDRQPENEEPEISAAHVGASSFRRMNRTVFGSR